MAESNMPESTGPAPEVQPATGSPSTLDSVSKLIQVVSVVVGVIISVLSFNATRETEARARAAEAAKPFLELRQKLYLEAVQAAAVLANRDTHPDEAVKKAKARFRELYVAELSLIEAADVEGGMMTLAEAVDPDLLAMTREQVAAYRLAHALRDSLVKSWGLDEKLVDNPERLHPPKKPASE